MQKVRLSKRQIKEDKFTTTMLNAKTQFIENWQFYVIGLVAVVIIVAGAAYVADYQGRRQVEASEKFSRAMSAFQGNQTQVATVALNEIVEDYGGEDVAEQAIFMLGRVNLMARNYTEALRYYEMYIAKYDFPRNRAAALAGMAACYENQGDFEQAQSKYMEAFQSFADGPLADDYEYSALRMALKTGDTDAALERLRSISENYPGTEVFNNAQRLAGEYGVLLPPSQ